MITRLNFIFSSISFLQLYLPIVNYGNKLGIKSVFYIRSNSKLYACPVHNKKNVKIYKAALAKYNIVILNITEITKLKKTILFVVDGDIYGPQEKNIKKSGLITNKISPSVKIISLCEHLNFLWIYQKYIKLVNHVVFPNEIYPKYYGFENNKNIFLGNTKYDDICEPERVYSKFNIAKDHKYVLFLFPKIKYIKAYTIIDQNILNLYKHIHQLGFKIIVKQRPKDQIFDNCKGDVNIISDTYPNQTLELLQICDFSIMFSSSALDEAIMMETSIIDFVVDTEIKKRLEFFHGNNVIVQVTNWKTIDFDKFKNFIDTIAPKKSAIFKELKEKYLFTHSNTAEKIIHFVNKLKL